MPSAPGTLRFGELATSPSAPPAGYALLYVKTDNVVYLQDSGGTEIPLGTASGITSLTGDVTGTGPGAAATTVVTVGGQLAANIGAATVKVLAATSAATANALVERDASGNFAANVITASLNGNASTATTAGSSIDFSGTLAGDVTGNQTSTVVATVGGSTAANIHSAELAANAATPINTASTIVKRDASGNFTANVITAATFSGNLTGNVTGNVSGSSSTFTGSLVGDVTGTQGATVVATVGGSSAANIHLAELAANAATASNTASTIVERDSSGNFAAGTITASLTGNVTGNLTGNVTGNVSGSSASFTGSLAGDVTGTQGATAIASTVVTGKLLTGLTSGANTAILATDSILKALEKLQAQTSGTTGTAITSLTGDVSATGPGSATAVVNSVGGSSAANIHSAELAANAATATNTASTIVERDASGNFAANVITASLTGAASAKVLKAGDTMPGALSITATGTGLNVSHDASIGGALGVTGNITGGNLSGTNTGDVTLTSTNSIALSFSAGQTRLSANLNLSAAAADANNLKATYSIKSDGLFIEYAFGVPVNIGTTNVAGSATSFSLSDHVHAITSPVVLGLTLTGYVPGTNTPITAANSMLTAFQNLQAQISSSVGAAITSLTGDVTATGPGAAAATISVGAVTDTKASLAAKPAVAVVATTNQPLTGLGTIDGVTQTAGQLVLLTAQTTASQNGPWVAQTGAWTRPTWFPSGGTTQAIQFSTTLVRLRTTYQGSVWRMTTAGAITIDTTSTTWVVTPVSGNYKANFNIGPATGASAVNLNFSNVNVGTLSWNPSSSFGLVLPPSQGGVGSYL